MGRLSSSSNVNSGGLTKRAEAGENELTFVERLQCVISSHSKDFDGEFLEWVVESVAGDADKENVTSQGKPAHKNNFYIGKQEEPKKLSSIIFNFPLGEEDGEWWKKVVQARNAFYYKYETMKGQPPSTANLPPINEEFSS